MEHFAYNRNKIIRLSESMRAYNEKNDETSRR